MVEVERKVKNHVPTTRIISVFILVLSIIGISFSTNKLYEYHLLKQIINKKGGFINERYAKTNS